MSKFIAALSLIFTFSSYANAQNLTPKKMVEDVARIYNQDWTGIVVNNRDSFNSLISRGFGVWEDHDMFRFCADAIKYRLEIFLNVEGEALNCYLSIDGLPLGGERPATYMRVEIKNCTADGEESDFRDTAHLFYVNGSVHEATSADHARVRAKDNSCRSN